MSGSLDKMLDLAILTKCEKLGITRQAGFDGTSILSDQMIQLIAGVIALPSTERVLNTLADAFSTSVNKKLSYRPPGSVTAPADSSKPPKSHEKGDDGKPWVESQF